MNITVKFETKKAIANTVNKIKVDSMLSTMEINMITKEFGIEGMNGAELQDLRNQVVKVCSDVKRGLRADGKWGQFDRMDAFMSKTVTVIDERLYEGGLIYG